MFKRRFATILLAALLFAHTLAGVTTINPTANTNPDQGGTSAFTSANNTSGSSSAAATFSGFSGSDANADSCRWHTFSYSGPTPIAINLKFDWSANGDTEMDFLIVGSGNTLAQFEIEYTVNGGSNWSGVVSEGVALSDEGSDSFNTSGAVNQSIPAATTISQIQVRARMDASVSVSSSEDGNTADANVSGSISNIRLEITTPSGNVIVMM